MKLRLRISKVMFGTKEMWSQRDTSQKGQYYERKTTAFASFVPRCPIWYAKRVPKSSHDLKQSQIMSRTYYSSSFAILPCSTILILVSGNFDIWFDADFCAWNIWSSHKRYVRISFGKIGQLYSINIQCVASFLQPSFDWHVAMVLVAPNLFKNRYATFTGGARFPF